MNRSAYHIAFGIAVLVLASAIAANAADPPAQQRAFRPPAVPLVTSNPYLSVWSMADRLTDDETRHWTRREHPLSSLIRIDGKTYRLMGAKPEQIPALPQVGLRVLPTRTIYDFEGEHVHVKLTFMTPALPDDLAVLARPLTYLTWEVSSTGTEAHSISIFTAASARLAADPPGQDLTWLREVIEPITALRVGTVTQRVLQRAGDDTSIDWGYLYLAAATAGCSHATGTTAALAERFAAEGTLRSAPALENRDSGTSSGPDFVLAFGFDEFRAAARPVSRHLMIAYDEVYSIKFLGRKLRPYWRRDGATPPDLFRDAERDYDNLVKRL